MRRPQVIRDRLVAAAAIAEQDQILHVDKPEDIVEIVPVHGNARILLLAEQRAQLVERRVGGDGHDVGPRGHHFAYQRVAEIDDRLQQLALFLMPGRRIARIRSAPRR